MQRIQKKVIPQEAVRVGEDQGIENDKDNNKKAGMKEGTICRAERKRIIRKRIQYKEDEH